VIEEYAARAGIALKPKYEGENISSAMSLVASSGGVTLVPLYAQNMLSPNVVARALEGIPPKVDLVLGYAEENPSPLLRRLLSRANEMIVSVQNQSIIQYAETQIEAREASAG
jgi:LysR family hca operon transcriptional activator